MIQFLLIEDTHMRLEFLTELSGNRMTESMKQSRASAVNSGESVVLGAGGVPKFSYSLTPLPLQWFCKLVKTQYKSLSTETNYSCFCCLQLSTNWCNVINPMLVPVIWQESLPAARKVYVSNTDYYLCDYNTHEKQKMMKAKIPLFFSCSLFSTISQMYIYF